MLASMWAENNYIHFFQPHSTFFVKELTLCLPTMDIRTLVDIVIANPTQANLFP